MKSYGIFPTVGDTFAVAFDGDDVIGICGPLDDVEAAVADIANAAEWDYSYSDDMDQDERDAWFYGDDVHAAIAFYDETGNVTTW